MSVPPKVARAVAPVRRRVDALRARVVDTMLWQVWERLLENEFIDRGVALAAKAFVSLFPALIVVAAFLPASVRDSVSSTVYRRAGLSGEGFTTVKQAFASSDDVRRATGFLGLLLTFFYINSFVTALQRVYVKAWRRPKTGRAAAYAIGAAWLVSLVAYFALLGTARALLRGGPTTVLFLVFAYVVTTATWTITPWIMLQREVRFRVLVPTGILTGTAMLVYAVTASLWMPEMVNQNQRQFGFFGVALALVTWLTGAATIIVVAGCTGPVLAADTGPIGRLARGPDEDVLAPGAPPSLPAPVQGLRISAAFGRQRPDEPDPPAT